MEVDVKQEAALMERQANKAGAALISTASIAVWDERL